MSCIDDRFFHLIIYYIVGMRLGKANYFEYNEYNKKFCKYILLVCIALSTSSLAFTPSGVEFSISIYFQYSYGVNIEGDKGILYEGVWISLLSLKWFKYKGMKWQRPLVPYGRMSLTNYVFQSILGIFIYYPMGLGLYNKVGSTVSVILAWIIFVLQCLFS
ncbi:DUF418 domain-containing protein [Prolixibacteraceae bacterium]|nr:DUF418 domain-containing protein [Prolixibacteraceae bacterium]